MRTLLALSLVLSLQAAHADPLTDIGSDVSASRLMASVKYLSGATSSIATRYSPTAGSVLAQNWLKGQFEALGYTTVLQDWGTYQGYACSDNVIARKVGVLYPQLIYVICAHYDSTSNNPWNLAPGADDNASGVSAVLEAALLLKDYPTDYTIEFVAFSGEEQGLYGSKYYVQNPAGRQWAGAINLDMIGYAPVANPSLWVVSCKSPSPIADLVRAISLYLNPGTPVVRYTYPYGVSDNYPFYQRNIPECLLIEHDFGDSNPYYHRTTDTWDKLTAEYLRVCATAGIASVAYAAGVSNGYAAVLMPEYVGSRAGLGVELQLREPGGGPVVATYAVTLDAAGVFRLPDALPRGTWDLAVKAPGWLRRASINVSVPNLPGLSFTLTPGDVNGDNVVDIADLALLLAAFGLSTPGADVDGSGSVGLEDLNLVLLHFGEAGD